MEIEKYFLVNQFCISHNIEIEFIESLQEIGYINIHHFENERYIQLDRLTSLEKAIRLNQELEVGINELEIVLNLLEKIENLQDENRILKANLAIFRNAPQG